MLLTEAVPERQAWHAPGFDLRRITMISLIYAAQGRQGLPLPRSGHAWPNPTSILDKNCCWIK